MYIPKVPRDMVLLGMYNRSYIRYNEIEELQMRLKMFTIYNIPIQNLPKFLEKSGKLIDRIERKGLHGVVSVEVHPELDFVEHGKEESTLYRPVFVNAVAPKFNGWTFAASLQRTKSEHGVGTVIRRSPGVEADLSKWQKETASWCDHCQTSRYRRNTYIVKHDDGSLKEVGSSCIRDFLGQIDLNRLAEYFKFLNGMVFLRHNYGSTHENPTYSTEQFLGYAAQTVLDYGWVSQSKAEYGEKHATSMEASYAFCWYVLGTRPQRWTTAPPKPSEEAIHIATRVMEEALSMDLSNENSDWKYNIKTLCTLGVMEMRNIGLMTSAVLLYFRPVWQEEKRLKDLEAIADSSVLNEWIGVAGIRQDFGIVELVKVIPSETQYGALFVHKFVDADGRTLAWFTGSNHELGQYILKGTVKKHAEWNSIKETHVSRCVLKSL